MNQLNKYGEWVEAVVNAFSDEFYNENDYWVDYDKTCDDWMLKLYRNEKNPVEAAKIIERAFSINEVYRGIK